ncbi:MAG: hypothetical protein R2789_15190 [Microthrixaceae bacterium]
MSEQPATDVRPADAESFFAMVGRLRERQGYTEPTAFGIGLATVADSDRRSSTPGSARSTWAPTWSGRHRGRCGGPRLGQPVYFLAPEDLNEILGRCAPMLDDAGEHPNLDVLRTLAADGTAARVGRRCRPTNDRWSHSSAPSTMPRRTSTTPTCDCTCSRTA